MKCVRADPRPHPIAKIALYSHHASRESGPTHHGNHSRRRRLPVWSIVQQFNEVQ